jgi:NitT/TauT family transport system substrate-binding protein
MRHLRVVLALGLLLAPLAAEAGSPIRVGSMATGGNTALFCAVEYGSPTNEGIDLQLTNVGNGARILEAMAGGSLDIGYSTTLSVLQAAERGLELSILAPGGFVRTDDQPAGLLMVRKDSGISSAADLRGKTIGLITLRAFDYLFVAEYLSRAGVTERDVRWQEVAVAHMPAALEHRRVDAAWIIEPHLTVMRESGTFKGLLMAQDIAPGASMMTYVALRPWAEARRPLVDAFLRAFRRGVEACQREPSRMQAALAKHANVKSDVVQRMVLPLIRPTLLPADVAAVQQLARRHRLLERDVDVGRLLLSPDGSAR